MANACGHEHADGSSQCSHDDGLDDFAVSSSNNAPVILMRQNSAGKKEVCVRYCCGKLLRSGSTTCAICGTEVVVDQATEDSATMCVETWKDAVCCETPITFNRRSCKKCGKYFPTALELAQQAAMKVDFRINLAKRLTSINQQFFKFMNEYLKSDDYTYYEFIDCFNQFEKRNHSWKGFPAREVFKDNIIKTGVVILTQGMDGLRGDPRALFPKYDIDDYRMYFV